MNAPLLACAIVGVAAIVVLAGTHLRERAIRRRCREIAKAEYITAYDAMTRRYRPGETDPDCLGQELPEIDWTKVQLAKRGELTHAYRSEGFDADYAAQQGEELVR